MKNKSEEAKQEPEQIATENPVLKLTEELAQAKEAKLMALADLDNYRKRVEKEKADLMTYANLSMLQALADLIDDFDNLAVDLTKKYDEKINQQLQPLRDKLQGVMTDFGVTEIVVKPGEKFNPTTMQAIGTVMVKEENQKDTVQHVAQKGYKNSKNDNLIRAARVIVAKLAP